jgi:hypothetical protein
MVNYRDMVEDIHHMVYRVVLTILHISLYLRVQLLYQYFHSILLYQIIHSPVRVVDQITHYLHHRVGQIIHCRDRVVDLIIHYPVVVIHQVSLLDPVLGLW